MFNIRSQGSVNTYENKFKEILEFLIISKKVQTL